MGRKSAQRRKADGARRRARAKELENAADKRYQAALALVKRESAKLLLTKSVREGLARERSPI